MSDRCSVTRDLYGGCDVGELCSPNKTQSGRSMEAQLSMCALYVKDPSRLDLRANQVGRKSLCLPVAKGASHTLKADRTDIIGYKIDILKVPVCWIVTGHLRAYEALGGVSHVVECKAI